MMGRTDFPGARDHDAIIKLLVTGRSRTFFKLLGAPDPREEEPTEVFRPRVLRLDHLSSGLNGDLLHIEFQSSREEMRWRMLEYYSAIATRHGLPAMCPGDSVARPLRQIVFLMGEATEMPKVLERDGLRLGFEVRRLSGVDPLRRLAASADPYDKVLGLLCVETASNEDWRGACAAIAGASDPEVARDAFALLLAVTTLIDAPKALTKVLEEMTVLIDIEKSPVLVKLSEKVEARGARSVLRRVIVKWGGDILEADEEFMATLTLDEISELTDRLLDGVRWSDIRPLGASVAPGDD